MILFRMMSCVPELLLCQQFQYRKYVYMIRLDTCKRLSVTVQDGFPGYASEVIFINIPNVGHFVFCEIAGSVGAAQNVCDASDFFLLGKE